MLIHLWHFMGKPDDETHRRLMVARESREAEYLAYPGMWMAPAMSFARNSKKLGDDQPPVPFVRDMISQGLSYAKSTADIIFITNADVGFVPAITRAAEWGRCAHHMRRRDFPRIDQPITPERMTEGFEYSGADGFAFSVKWWKEHGKLFPDMLLGRYGWDSGMRNLVRRSGGAEVKNQLWHESHSAPWSETAHDIENNAGNRHNRALLEAWIEKYGGSVEDHLHPNLIYK